MAASETGRRRPSPVVVAAVLASAVLLAALGVRAVVVAPFHIPSGSMQPGLRAGDVVLADRGTRGSAERGDVVVVDGRDYFAAGSPDGDRYWVKRVIAVGGDRISCCDDRGALVRNGEPLAEPYLPTGTAPSEIAFDLEVPPGRLFLLGDNRSDSTDSRSRLGAPGGGMVPQERVVGKVTRIVWPLPRAGRLASIDSP